MPVFYLFGPSGRNQLATPGKSVPIGLQTERLSTSCFGSLMACEGDTKSSSVTKNQAKSEGVCHGFTSCQSSPCMAYLVSVQNARRSAVPTRRDSINPAAAGARSSQSGPGSVQGSELRRGSRCVRKGRRRERGSGWWHLAILLSEFLI